MEGSPESGPEKPTWEIGIHQCCKPDRLDQDSRAVRKVSGRASKQLADAEGQVERLAGVEAGGAQGLLPNRAGFVAPFLRPPPAPRDVGARQPHVDAPRAP